MSGFDNVKDQTNFKLITEGTIDSLNTNQPISFFPYRNVFRKHTPFGFKFTEISSPNVNNNSVANWGEKTTFLIDSSQSKGDLLHKMYLELILPDLTGELVTGGTNTRWVNNIGHALLKSITLKIDGKIIETHDSVWMDIWNEVTDVEEKEYGLIGKEVSIVGTTPDTDFYNNKTKWYIPLHFFFTKNKALSLPMFLLNNNTISIELSLRRLQEVVHYDGSPTFNSTGASNQPVLRLFTGNFYLSNEEKKAIEAKFMKGGYNFLIEIPERVTENTSVTSTSSFNVNLNNLLDYPIKEFYWVFRHADRLTTTSPDVPDDQNDLGGNQLFAYYGHTENTVLEDGIGTRDPFTTLEIKVGGKNILEETKKSDYFRTMQPYYYHPKLDTRYIYNLSFAQNPLDYDPSGFLYLGGTAGNSVRFEFGDILSTDYRFNLYTLGYRILRFSEISNGKLKISVLKGNGSNARIKMENVEGFQNQSSSQNTKQTLRLKPNLMKRFQTRPSSSNQKSSPNTSGSWSGMAGGFSSNLGDNRL